MESRARVLGHPIHQALVVFPLGLLGGSVGFDIAYLLTRNAMWAEIAYYLIGAGVIMGLIAAPFGWLDWTAIPRRTRAKTVGVVHGLTNGLVLLVFAVSFSLRKSRPDTPPMEAQVCSFVALMAAFVGAWFGGELVSRLGIGVSPIANPDAPSSLTHPGVHHPR